MPRATPTRILTGVTAVIYLVFGVSCFRLAQQYNDDRNLSIGEGLFTLLGAVTLIAAVFLPRWRAPVVLLGTLPLVGWFIATPYNSGPPFLIASLVAPVAAALGGAASLRRAAA